MPVSSNQRQFWGRTVKERKNLLGSSDCFIIMLYVLIILLMLTNVFVILQLSKLNNEIIKPLENASGIIKGLAQTALPWLSVRIKQARSFINIVPAIVSTGYEALTSVGSTLKGYLQYFI